MVGNWHDPELGRPIAAPLERCAELLDVNLATVCELAAKVEPYVRADGTRVWSLTQLERQLRPKAYRRRRGATLTADELRLPMYKPGRRRQGEPPCSSSTNDSSPPFPGQLVGLDLVNPLLCVTLPGEA